MNPWQHRLLWLSTIAIFVGLPFSKAISSIGMGLLALSALIVVLQTGISRPTKIFYPLIGIGTFVVFFLISSLYSSSLWSGLNQTFKQHAFLTIPVCFWVLREWIQPRIAALMQFFIGACVIHGLITLGLFMLPEPIVSDTTSTVPLLRPYPELTDRLKFGLYTPFLDRLNLAYLLGFGILYLIYDGVSSSWKTTNIAQGLILLATFLLIGARGAQLALLASITIVSLPFIIHRLQILGLSKQEYLRRLTSSITVLALCVFLAPYIAYKTVPAVTKRYDQMQWELKLIENGDYKKEAYQYFSVLTRIRAWQNATSVILANPIIGAGIGDYNDEMAKANALYEDRVPVHNQNYFLYIWGAAGVFALITFLLGLYFYLQSFWIDTNGYMRFLALSYVIFICISCAMDAFLKYHIGSLSVTVLLSSMFLVNVSGETKEA